MLGHDPGGGHEAAGGSQRFFANAPLFPIARTSQKRWQAFTGAAAKLESNGRTFADVATERKQADGPSRTQA
jgi:hypothetical protein